MNKRILSILLVLTMVLGSATVALAAPYDLVHRTDSTKTYSMNRFAKEPAVFKKVMIEEGLENYLIEAENGKLYVAEDVEEATKDGTSFNDAVAGLEPVEIEEPSEGLEVIEVSAINNTDVTVIVEPVKEASEEATIEVKNSKDEVVAVEPIVVEVGETELVFDFAEEQKEEALVGVWKVNGVEYNFDAIKQLGDIKKEATAPVNEIKFLAALNAAGIKNVDENKLSEYATKLVEKDEEIETLEDVQAIIDEVNKGEATKEEQDAAVKAVKEAKNQIQLLAALEAGFERVNADWIVEYATDSTNGLLGKDNLTFEGIQNAVDAINKEKVEEKITAAEAKLDSKLVSEAKTLVENYIKEDGKNETAKKEMLDKLAVHQAVINVNLANTNNKLDAAFKALAELVEDNVFDIETVKPELLKAYRDAIAEEAKKETPANKTAANIQTIVSGVNQAAGEAEEALKINFDIKQDGTNGAGKTTLGELKDGVITVTGDYLALTEYPSNNDTPPATAKWIGLKIALKDGDTAISGNPDLKLTLDGDDVREFKLGKEYDGQAENEVWYYFVPQAGGNTKTLNFELEYTKDEETIKKKDGFTVKFVDELSQDGVVVLVNEAETAEDVDAALLELPVEDYLNIPKADRLFVAEKVLETRNEKDTKKFADYNALTTALEGVIGTEGTYTKALDGVNELTAEAKIAEVIDALEKVDPEGFAKMTNAEKAEIAEAFFAGLEFNDDTEGTLKTTFRTLAAVKAAAGL